MELKAPDPTTSGLLQTAVPLVAALIAVLYPIGYTLLVLRLAITYTHSLTMAWYAASLVPATTVLGQVLDATLLVAIVSAVVFIFVERIPPPPRRIQLRRSRAYALLAIGVFVAVVLIVTRQYAFLGGAAFGGIVGAGSPLLENLRRKNRISALTRFGTLAGLIYLGLTGIGLVPPIDPASVVARVDLGGGHLSGARLLAHTDGYWYVFTPDGVLHAVPDSQAGATMIHP